MSVLGRSTGGGEAGVVSVVGMTVAIQMHLKVQQYTTTAN